MSSLQALLRSPRYEVIPAKSTERAVLDWVPAGMTVTVTASPVKGLDPTIELAERLTARGYQVVPHLAARSVAGEEHLAEIIGRLKACGVDDVFAGPSRVASMFRAEPGTYVLTDFLLRSFDRSVLAGLGLDRHPELWADYFRHYQRLVWLAQEPSPALTAQAERVAAMFGLPLTRIDTGVSRLERELSRLVEEAL